MQRSFFFYPTALHYLGVLAQLGVGRFGLIFILKPFSVNQALDITKVFSRTHCHGIQLNLKSHS